MTEDELRALVVDQLKRFGMDAVPLPVRPMVKTADLRCSMGGDVFFIELKQRERVAQYNTDLAALNLGDVAELIPQSLEYQNNLSAVIRDGVSQLSATVESEGCYRLLWFDAGDVDAELDVAQYEATLCGERYLFCLDRTELVSCYFFSESEFFTCRNDLDGSFVSGGGELKLILNSYSPRYEAIRQSDFVRGLGNAVWDPAEMERQGWIMVADTDLNRRNEWLVLAYICEKYGVQANVMPIRRYGAVALINSPQEDA